MSMNVPEPTKAEAMALFRLGVVGDLLARELSPGELRDELVARAAERYRPPDATASRQFHWKTLQSWYYAAKHGGHRALAPASRKQGFALALSPETRDLLLQIRTENPSAPANLILDTAVRQGVVEEGQLSVSTLRRLFAEAGLPRTPANRALRRDRRRWEAARVGAVWHADVCHVWVREPDGTPRKVYVHGILDDHSRFVVALEGRDSETEVDFLSVLCAALLQYPPPDVLYVDNGSCYRGDVLALACAKLGIKLVHAKAYDPQARGKMERFWRRLRERCTDYLKGKSSLHDVNAALLAFLDAEYHTHPHSSLLGETPSKRFRSGLGALRRAWTAKELAVALEITVKRRVAGDATFSLEGRTFEVRGRHLANKTIEVVLDPFTGAILRASFQDKPVVVGACDPALNRGRRRAKPEAAPAPTLSFDPIAALLDRARKETGA
ncbi:MAG: DDE-type integrase/transposase/recombinase [Gemmatimonadota bacterium]|nr:DDE-type integrase/transposase/recombinase [Gemmatimonadota bacterium]